MHVSMTGAPESCSVARRASPCITHRTQPVNTTQVSRPLHQHARCRAADDEVSCTCAHLSQASKQAGRRARESRGTTGYLPIMEPVVTLESSASVSAGEGPATDDAVSSATPDSFVSINCSLGISLCTLLTGGSFRMRRRHC